MISDFDGDTSGHFNHLGHWDDPAADPLATPRPVAQQRMNDVLVGMAGVADGAAVLDVGSGLGGTLGSIARSHTAMRLVGLEVDERQLQLCRAVDAGPGNALHWVRGDACSLPFPSQSFDHLLSIEAMWHFPSRRRFLGEAARVLRPGGGMAVVDLFITPDAPQRMGLSREELVRTLEDGFAPWPEPGARPQEVLESAAEAGLECVDQQDATANTAPTYLDHGDGHERPRSAEFSATEAVQLFVRMHLEGVLRIVYLSFRRR